jgi:hypothetical protein
VPDGNATHSKERRRKAEHKRFVLAQPDKLWYRSHETRKSRTGAECHEHCRQHAAD